MKNPGEKMQETTLSERWAPAVLAERKDGAHIIMIDALTEYTGPRNTALIFGDACKVNTKYLLDEAGFELVTNMENH